MDGGAFLASLQADGFRRRDETDQVFASVSRLVDLEAVISPVCEHRNLGLSERASKAIDTRREPADRETFFLRLNQPHPMANAQQLQADGLGFRLREERHVVQK